MRWKPPTCLHSQGASWSWRRELCGASPSPGSSPRRATVPCASANSVLCRTPDDFRNGFTFRKHQCFCISLVSSAFCWSRAVVRSAVKRHERRWVFPAASGLLHVLFPAAVHSALPQRRVLTCSSPVRVDAHSSLSTPRSWAAGLWIVLPPRPWQQSTEAAMCVLVTLW